MKLSKWLCVMGLLLLTAACEKEDFPKNLKSMQFNSSIEALTSSDNSKVFLYKEQWVFWELGDQISIGSDLSTGTPQVGDLVNASPGTDFENFNGVFIAPLPEGSKYFVGLHPQRAANVIRGNPDNNTFADVKIDLRAEQPRTPYGGTDEDLTFARKVFPMSAWIGDPWDASHPNPYQLDFHALGGIVRIQLYNISGSDATIKNIQFVSRDGSGVPGAGSGSGYTGGNLQLNGLFDVKNYKTATPWLVPTEPTTTDDAKKTITLTFGDGLAFNSSSAGEGDIKTFYLVLPALGDNNFSTVYKLQMTINATVGGTPKTFTKNFNVSVRRRGITNMRALGVNSWATPTVTTGLAGNGTADRPFKIYTLADMQYLRDHYNGDRKLNGQPITENTHIVLMRSDIELNTSNWTGSPITNFIGVFDDSTHASTHPGITNKSNLPIFENILAGGHVRHLTVKTDGTHISASSSMGVSPFCNFNYGKIELCRVVGSVQADAADLAGIAAQNLDGGIISKCACEASLTVMSGRKVAGICFNNSGYDASDNPSTIEECYATGAISVTATEAAGVCYSNTTVVKDCYFAATVGANSANWGGIVFTNSGLVDNSSNSATNLATTGTLGGIVHTSVSGTINDCWLAGSLEGSSVGGVVYNVIGGKVINCYTDGYGLPLSISATSVAGGLVAVFSGAGSRVENCYVYDINISGATKGGLIGTVANGTINNCYSYEGYARNFYGSKSSGTLTRCYMVNPITPQVDVTSLSATDADMTILLNNLNASSLPTGGRKWNNDRGISIFPAPFLGDYPSKKRR